MNQSIADFVKGRRVAIAGVSRTGKKFGNRVYEELKARGFEVFAVHPLAKEIGGAPCCPNLAALKERVDGAVVVLPPAQALPVLREAASIGLKNVWLQQGAESPEAEALGRELKLNLVSGKCILMYAAPVRSFHAFHRAVMKLFGKL